MGGGLGAVAGRIRWRAAVEDLRHAAGGGERWLQLHPALRLLPVMLTVWIAAITLPRMPPWGLGLTVAVALVVLVPAVVVLRRDLCRMKEPAERSESGRQGALPRLWTACVVCALGGILCIAGGQLSERAQNAGDALEQTRVGRPVEVSGELIADPRPASVSPSAASPGTGESGGSRWSARLTHLSVSDRAVAGSLRLSWHEVSSGVAAGNAPPSAVLPPTGALPSAVLPSSRASPSSGASPSEDAPLSGEPPGASSPESPMPRRGDRVRVSVKLRKTALGDRDRAWAAALGSPRVVSTESDSAPVEAVLGNFRRSFTQQAAVLPGDGGVLVPGLAVGETSELPDDLVQAMRESGLTHLTAVSGANCAILTAGCFYLCGFLGLPRRLRIIGAGIFLLLFCLLVGGEPSVLRAGWMAAIALAMLYRGKPRAGAAVLSIAATALLCVDPTLALDVGFALSVAATFGLLLWTRPIAATLSRVLPQRLALALAVPCAAHLACQPLLILLQPQLGLVSIPANLCAEPAVPLVTILGLLACIAAPWAPMLAQGLCWLAWFPATWIASVARAATTLSWLNLPWTPGLWGAVLAAIGCGVLVGVLCRVSRLRRVILVLGVIAVTLGGAAPIVGPVIQRAIVPEGWSLALCDVGQGDAVVVRDHEDVLLVDTGPSPAALRECLSRLGISHISALALSHYDNDHVGGVSALSGRVDQVLLPAADPRDAAAQSVVETLRHGGAAIAITAMPARGTVGTISWSALWPPPGLTKNRNDAALVLSIAVHGIRALFLADLSAAAQSGVLATHPALGRVDVVKVAHHGSGDQDPALYERVAPRLGLISVGAGNSYGHPRARTLAMLGELGVLTVRSDRRGLTLVSVPDTPATTPPAVGSSPPLHLWSDRGG